MYETGIGAKILQPVNSIGFGCTNRSIGYIRIAFVRSQVKVPQWRPAGPVEAGVKTKVLHRVEADGLMLMRQGLHTARGSFSCLIFRTFTNKTVFRTISESQSCGSDQVCCLT